MSQTYDGATTALQRELRELRAKYDRDISDKEIAHQAEIAELRDVEHRLSNALIDLATERAAREKAEKRAEDWQVWCQSANRDNAALEGRMQQAERERDAALADIERMKRTHGDRDEWVLAAQRADTARMVAESALASAQQEFERRTARSNEQIQKLGKQLADAEDKLAGCSESVETCHRQHEQCMKLLEMAKPLIGGTPLGMLIHEMLINGELPEGWDE